MLVGATVALSMAASQAPRLAVHVSWIASLVILVAMLFTAIPRQVVVASGLVLSLLMISVPVAILRRITRHEVITATTMWGAIAVYMALGMGFSLAYSAVHLANPSSFPSVVGGGLSDFNYFSYVTMTTLGYGDVTPVTDLPRALAILQTLIGQIFLVVIVARVVSLLGKARPNRPLPAGPDQKADDGPL